MPVHTYLPVTNSKKIQPKAQISIPILSGFLPY